ncbi:hypothetical protein HORIV_64600 [Vreelandella olivaria]|uniref:CBS domain-containing protein n=1 Tax=Vreelandella olivaria TaxID=390919 RepID=A0ABN5X443_9GAMM|nr:hypothetical protein HORIV_64600 [Halomonas olivaria]
MRDDEKYTNNEELLLYLQKLLDTPDTAALQEFFTELDILDIARTLESFPAKTRDYLWEYVPDAIIGEVLAEVDEDIRADYIEDLSASDVEQIVKGLDAQEVAEVLDVADEAIKTSVYASLDQDIRAQVENLHAYEDDVVGRYMDPETVNVKQGVSLEAVQRYIRIHHLLDDESQQIMITDKDKRLLGTLTLIDLIKQPQDAVVDDYMDDFFTLNDQMKVSDAAALLRSKELHFVPVCDSEGLLVGQLNSTDVLEITQDDADMTLKHMSGVSDEEEVFTPLCEAPKAAAFG